MSLRIKSRRLSNLSQSDFEGFVDSAPGVCSWLIRSNYDQDDYLEVLHEQDDNCDTNEDSEGQKNDDFIRSELHLILSIAWPVLTSTLFAQAINFTAVVFVGHLSPSHLAAIGLAITFLNVTGFSIGYGFCSAIDTLCAQAFGANNFAMVGLTLQRAVVIITLSCIPVFLLWSFCEQILLSLEQNEEVAKLAGKYCYYAMLGYWPVVTYEAATRYFAAQNIVRITIWSGLAANASNILLLWIFVNYLNLGIFGAAVAVSLSNWVLPISMTLISWMKKYHEKTWVRFSNRAFKNWKPLLSLGFAGVSQMCLTWWGYEVYLIIAGLRGTKELAAYNIALQLEYVLWSFPWCISTAASMRTGYYLGAGSSKHARSAALLSLATGFILAVTVGLVVTALHKELPKVFSDDLEVQKIASDMIFVVGGLQILDSIESTSAAIIRGVGLQKYAVYAGLVGHYLFGIPLGVILTFSFGADFGAIGLWYGLAIALVAENVVLLIILSRVDWNQQVIEAKRRTEETCASIASPKITVTAAETHSSTITETHASPATGAATDDMWLSEAMHKSLKDGVSGATNRKNVWMYPKEYD